MTRLDKPGIIFSVAGGALNQTIDEQTKKCFKLGLMRAAKSTDSWIVTRGTDVGVMQVIGDIIDENMSAQDLKVFGITNYKHVKEFLDQKTNSRFESKVSLNSNHSFFILIDNIDEKTDEISIRNYLLNIIKVNLKVPMILIVLEGGLDTIKTIYYALKDKIPIILMAVRLTEMWLF